jgi:hypothetical protein
LPQPSRLRDKLSTERLSSRLNTAISRIAPVGSMAGSRPRENQKSLARQTKTDAAGQVESRVPHTAVNNI